MMKKMHDLQIKEEVDKESKEEKETEEMKTEESKENGNGNVTDAEGDKPKTGQLQRGFGTMHLCIVAEAPKSSKVNLLLTFEDKLFQIEIQHLCGASCKSRN